MKEYYNMPVLWVFAIADKLKKDEVKEENG